MVFNKGSFGRACLAVALGSVTALSANANLSASQLFLMENITGSGGAANNGTLPRFLTHDGMLAVGHRNPVAVAGAATYSLTGASPWNPTALPVGSGVGIDGDPTKTVTGVALSYSGKTVVGVHNGQGYIWGTDALNNPVYRYVGVSTNKIQRSAAAEASNVYVISGSAKFPTTTYQAAIVYDGNTNTATATALTENGNMTGGSAQNVAANGDIVGYGSGNKAGVWQYNGSGWNDIAYADFSVNFSGSLPTTSYAYYISEDSQRIAGMWRNTAFSGVNQNQLFVADWDSNLGKYVVNTMVDTATDANDANVSFDLRQVKSGSGDGRYVTGIGDLMNGVADSWIYDCQENKAYSLQKMILDLGGPAVDSVVVEAMSLDGSTVTGYMKVKAGYVTPGGQTPATGAFVPFAIRVVPEPSSILALGLGVGAFLARRRRS